MKTLKTLKPSIQLSWLILFAVVVALLGGSSRPDQVQLIALRPLSALFVIPVLYYLSADRLHKAKMPCVLFGILAFWMLFQLIPWPPTLWENLPERDKIAQLDQLVGLGEVWRPIALAPMRGWNALASLIVPGVALLLALAVAARARVLMLMIFGLGVTDALLGVLQVLSGGSGPFYFYSITSLGSAVGVFANENHSGVFSAIAMLITVRLGIGSRECGDPRWMRLIYPPAFVLILVASLISGSRTALAVAMISLIACAAMVLLKMSERRHDRRSSKLGRWFEGHRWLVAVLFLASSASLFAVFFVFGRAEGLEEMLSENPVEGLRVMLWPILLDMMAIHWVWGTGFGSFEEVYHIYEPTNLLIPQYLNQAHNDFAQLLIEGGAPAAALLLTLFVWTVLSVRTVAMREARPATHIVFWLTTFLILAVGSAVDYPLRTPVFQLVFVWLILSLSLERNALLQHR